MKTQDFDKWLADYFGQEESQITELLSDATATRFLIAWSLFETSYFQGRAIAERIEKFTIPKETDLNSIINELDEYVSFFHNRYQNNTVYKNLMHKNTNKRMENLIKKSFTSLNSEEKIFFAMLVVFRYRNNIFHGNKRVQHWSDYKDCILKCITMMQLLIIALKKDNN